LNIKNREVERLADEVARMAEETKTEAIRQALLDRRARLQANAQGKSSLESLRNWLEREVWPTVPPDQLGRTLTREEEDEILLGHHRYPAARGWS
jgi:antitoxin VapB